MFHNSFRVVLELRIFRIVGVLDEHTTKAILRRIVHEELRRFRVDVQAAFIQGTGNDIRELFSQSVHRVRSVTAVNLIEFRRFASTNYRHYYSSFNVMIVMLSLFPLSF